MISGQEMSAVPAIISNARRSASLTLLSGVNMPRGGNIKPCLPGCECKRHTSSGGWGSKPCEIGCTCGHHPWGKRSPEDEREIGRAAEKERNKRTQEYRSLRKHGLTPEDFAELWKAQDGRCYLCERDLPRERKQVHVDHDHTCCPPRNSCDKCRRGLACQGCNTAIGYANDDPDRMEIMAANLRRVKAETRQRIQEELPINVRRLERREESA